jgi:plasmid stabilization system protein ParE
MELSVVWTDFSKLALRAIFDYYKKEASPNVARRLVTAITKAVGVLHKQPFAGQQEELLTDRPEGFRYLIHKNYKIIYWINKQENRVEITDVFDTRQNPIKITRS